MKKWNATQQKLYDIVADTVLVKESNYLKKKKNDSIFLFYCTNEYCPHLCLSGKRIKNHYWKDDFGFNSFCKSCNQNTKFTKDEFSRVKKSIEKS